MVNFLSTRTPRSLSRMLLFSWSALSIYRYAGWFLPMCRIWHFPLLNCLRFLSAHFFSLLRSLLMAAQPCNIQPLFPVLCPQQTSWGYSAPSSMNTLNRTGASTILDYSTSYWPITTLSSTDHHPLGPSIQPGFSPPYSLLIQPILISFSVRIMGHIIKSLTEGRQYLLLPPYQSKQSFHYRWLSGWLRFPFVNWQWLITVTFLSFMCLETVSRINCSITLPGVEDWPVVPCTFLALFEDRNDICFPSDLKHLSQLPSSFQDYWEKTQLHQPVPSTLLRASHRVPWIYVRSVCLSIL